MITAVLWDVDGTLLDFTAAERAAVRKLFAEFGLGECTDAMIARYSAINVSFWERLERNEIPKPRVLVGRFEQFFAEYGIDPGIAPAFNRRYQPALGDTIVYRDGSIDIVRSLRGKAQVTSRLDAIPGIGPARKKALMRHFKSIDDIIAASKEELAAVPGIPERQAQEIWDYFHSSEEEQV